MSSTLLHIAARVLSWPFLVLSLWILYRGHNLPGGGFIGGLMAATGFVLHDLSGHGRPARGFFSTHPSTFLTIGLGTALASTLPGLLGDIFMKGIWLPAFELPLLGKVLIGTPLVFDIGVYLTVIGFILLLADTISSEEP